jgi:hypothetical protein
VRDRTITTENKRFSKLTRKDKEIIWKKYYEVAPHALGYVMDILVKVNGLKKQGIDYVKESNRMIQFHKYGELISVCLGYEVGEFTEAYNKNIENQSKEIINNDYVCSVLLNLLTKVIGIGPISPTEFYNKLREHAIDYMGLNKYDNKKFPSKPESLSRHLKRFKEDFLKEEIRITWSHSGVTTIQVEQGVTEETNTDNNT